MPLLRWFVLQTILTAALIAGWMAGPLQQAISGDSHWYVLAVAAIGCAGLVLAAFGRIGDAARVQDILPIVAVIAMQMGILVALAAMGLSLSHAGDPAKAVGDFFSTLSTAFYVSIAALSSYLWLRITLWLCHGE